MTTVVQSWLTEGDERTLANERILEGNEEDRAAAVDNERLEFLGDAVLGLVVAEAMYLLYPEWREGELTRVRAQLVSRQHMAEVAARLELGRHLRLSKGEDRSGLRHKSTVLSNTMEAVFGRTSLANAMGSDFSGSRWPCGPMISNL